MFDSFTLVTATADLADERAARGVADLVEFRMDLASDPAAQLAAYDGDLPLLVTNRPAWEGGEVDGSDAAAESARLDALEAALGNDAVAAVDIELAALRRSERAVAVAETAASRGVEVVVSVHDFAGTPSERAMVSLLSAAASAGDVGKLAVTATDREDALALLSATHTVDAAGYAVATMAMGEAGRHTRAVAPVYGSKIGYAPVHAEDATAPGQYDLETLAELVGRLQSG
ncbi:MULTISPECIES: type I 3-dehydroquinate dehydratase [Halolamina]|uniref:type I 3-dehydroquinate dehydratase n=1 Tax=Halolamina TaxID=1075397 RepID=UPI000945AE0B|nr:MULTISPECIES: type I 3-dehydroquinate dehydratase [Halolamina]NHX37135.1 type I 3-dehydroquinate dehydratase [Halolamina sp. R1-12]